MKRVREYLVFYLDFKVSGKQQIHLFFNGIAYWLRIGVPNVNQNRFKVFFPWSNLGYWMKKVRQDLRLYIRKWKVAIMYQKGFVTLDEKEIVLDAQQVICWLHNLFSTVCYIMMRSNPDRPC